MKHNFLNKKEIPTQIQIINYFFAKEEGLNEMLESMDSMENDEFVLPNSMDDLGEPDFIECAIGKEWEIFRLMWDKEGDVKYVILLKKSFINLNSINII